MAMRAMAIAKIAMYFFIRIHLESEAKYVLTELAIRARFGHQY